MESHVASFVGCFLVSQKIRLLSLRLDARIDLLQSRDDTLRDRVITTLSRR